MKQIVCLAVLCVLGLPPLAPAFAEQQKRANSPAAPAKRPGSRTAPSDHQVPAGTFLDIELRTRLSSNTSQLADPVDGRLRRAITADGVELLPEGALVIGTVGEVESAGRKKPGRLAFSFHVIEHPQTGSRAMIKTTRLVFESARPPKGNVFPELLLEKGSDASVSLLAPLLVRIPATGSVQSR